MKYSGAKLVLSRSIYQTGSLDLLSEERTDELAVSKTPYDAAGREVVLLGSLRLWDVLLQSSLNSFLQVLDSVVAVDPELQGILLESLKEPHPLLLVGFRLWVGVILTEFLDLTVGSFHFGTRFLQRSSGDHLKKLVNHGL